MKRIADRIRTADTCLYEVKQYQAYSEKVEEKPWYSDPTLVVGGVVLGVSLAGVLGYCIGAARAK